MGVQAGMLAGQQPATCSTCYGADRCSCMGEEGGLLDGSSMRGRAGTVVDGKREIKGVCSTARTQKKRAPNGQVLRPFCQQPGAATGTSAQQHGRWKLCEAQTRPQTSRLPCRHLSQ